MNGISLFLLPGDKSTRQLSWADKSPSMQRKKAFMPFHHLPGRFIARQKKEETN